ncbi:SIS domain-containing protein [Nonomuraea sediminis]|uniref:SIS domain-containing protein n=1 Tax=Nonomuraea sediminis TaxID=2835864 RepID=UPI001BDD9883|nr:SIS domain-containing protein [Nonomuraea sediminis]
MTTHSELPGDAARAMEEIAAAVGSVPEAELDGIVEELLAARRIACYAPGREGLVLRGLVMRLFHAGLDAHYVGEMTCPAVGEGDLVVLSCGPGHLATVEALAGVAAQAGARLLYLTAQPHNPPAGRADRVVHITAQTMADDQASTAVLPMGSAYEIALFVLVDLITNRVRSRRSESPETLRSRHTNLE